MIESNTNAQIKKILRLKKSSRFRKKEGLFLIEGYKMVAEALQRNLVSALYVSESSVNEASEKWPAEKEHFIVVATKIFAELSDTVTPQGVLALAKIPSYPLEVYCKKENAHFLCLEDINDPGNLGTMIRTAEGAGMTGVILSKKTVDLFNPKTVRSTMGAMFRVPFFIVEDFYDTMKNLRNENFFLYAAHLEGKMCYNEEVYEGKLGILIGNEANGLSNQVSELADKKVKIPMKGQLESLNAAVAAALLMYEVARNCGGEER